MRERWGTESGNVWEQMRYWLNTKRAFFFKLVFSLKNSAATRGNDIGSGNCTSESKLHHLFDYHISRVYCNTLTAWVQYLNTKIPVLESGGFQLFCLLSQNTVMT